MLIEPDNVTFAANVVSTYNVIEAAMKLGVRKVIVASSETTYGVCFTEGDKDFHSFPLEEDYDVDPMDSYGLSKVCNEKTARAFAMRYGADIYALRIGNVIEPHEYKMFETFQANPMLRKRNAWSYIDARDLGEIVRLCLEKDGLGFQVFNATNDTITLETPTQEFLSKTFPHVPITRPLEGFEAPLSNRKAREVLGFKEAHNWRKYVKMKPRKRRAGQARRRSGWSARRVARRRGVGGVDFERPCQRQPLSLRAHEPQSCRRRSRLQHHAHS